MSAEILRRAAEQARREAATELAIAPAIERMYGGDDSGTRLTARRHAAIADSLEQHADDHSSYDCNWEPCAALAVARAYLGEAA